MLRNREFGCPYLTMRDATTHYVEREPSLDRGERPAYRIATDADDPAVSVPRAVAAITDCEPTDEEFVLYDVIDPDALGRLFDDRCDGRPRTRGRVVFELRGCRVEVRADGNHVVHGPRPDVEESETVAPESA